MKLLNETTQFSLLSHIKFAFISVYNVCLHSVYTCQSRDIITLTLKRQMKQMKTVKLKLKSMTVMLGRLASFQSQKLQVLFEIVLALRVTVQVIR